jgi:PEP-CTERM/exosortase A-associated glycosyltransferase
MRVLHILDHGLPLQSGYVYRTLGILRAQRELGWESTHLTSPKQGPCTQLEETVDGWAFARTPARRAQVLGIPLGQHLSVVRATATRLAELIPESKPDILHAHSPVLNALAALWVGRKYDLPVVYEVRALGEDAAIDHGTARRGGPRYQASRFLETVALKRAQAIVTISEGLRGEIVDRGIGSDKITVVPNAVDLNRFRPPDGPDPELAETYRTHGRVVIGYVGSFYGYEGLDLLLEALPTILSGRDDVMVLLVGGGREEERLRKLAVRNGLAERVTFTGWVAQEEVARYYSLMDVLVYPRRSTRLTEMVTPLKPLEAMAQDRLVLASNIGGHRELIADGETGVLFTADDPDDLVRRLDELIARRDLWPGIRARARDFVARERTWRAVVTRYEDAYDRALRQSAM